MTTKVCTDCLEEKSLTEYINDKKGKCGKTSKCKPCLAKRCILWRSQNKEKIKAYNHTDKRKQAERFRHKNNPKVIEKLKCRDRSRVDNLTDSYIVRLVARHMDGISATDVRTFPDLIKLKRKELTLKRKVYGKKQNKKTS